MHPLRVAALVAHEVAQLHGVASQHVISLPPNKKDYWSSPRKASIIFSQHLSLLPTWDLVNPAVILFDFQNKAYVEELFTLY
jgi:hypothetical protein